MAKCTDCIFCLQMKVDEGVVLGCPKMPDYPALEHEALLAFAEKCSSFQAGQAPSLDMSGLQRELG